VIDRACLYEAIRVAARSPLRGPVCLCIFYSESSIARDSRQAMLDFILAPLEQTTMRGGQITR
jgi:hypothetical protein